MCINGVKMMTEISLTLYLLSNWNFIIKDDMLETWQNSNVKRESVSSLFAIYFYILRRVSGFESDLCSNYIF